MKEVSKPESAVLLVRYEDLIEDLESCVQRIAAHLGLTISSERVKELLPFMSFAHMKQNEHQFQPISVKWKENFHFIRNGVVGDGRRQIDALSLDVDALSLCGSW